VAYLRIFNESGIATTWSWGATRLLMRPKVSLKRLSRNSTRSPRTRTPNSNQSLTRTSEISGSEVTSLTSIEKQLDYGFYATLQGNKNTYYASGLNDFETVEFAIHAGQDVVDSYFDSVFLESNGDAAQFWVEL
jgi:hypothetical protein